jgi:hypothetical protein
LDTDTICLKADRDTQFRIVNASEGKVDFEVDIHKDHTVN